MHEAGPDPELTVAYREFNQAKPILTVLSCSLLAEQTKLPLDIMQQWKSTESKGEMNAA